MSGSYNVFIGNGAGNNVGNVSYKLDITAFNTLIYGDGYDKKLAIGNGRSYSSYYTLYVNGPIYGTSVANSSDARLKKDVETISGALDKVLKLRGVSFYWKNKTEMAEAKGISADSIEYNYDSKKHIGVIAQELEAEFPELVNTDDDGFKSVEYSNIAPILLEAVKELKAEKDALQTTVETQQQQIDELKRLVEELLKK